jgi:hypothetical protein
MDERDLAHAEQYRRLQARQMRDAYCAGALQRLAADLESWQAAYPDIMTAEIEALQSKLRLAHDRFAHDHSMQLEKTKTNRQ